MKNHPNPFAPGTQHRWADNEAESENEPESFIRSDWKVTYMVTLPALIVICILGYFFVRS